VINTIVKIDQLKKYFFNFLFCRKITTNILHYQRNMQLILIFFLDIDNQYDSKIVKIFKLF